MQYISPVFINGKEQKNYICMYMCKLEQKSNCICMYVYKLKLYLYVYV